MLILSTDRSWNILLEKWLVDFFWYVKWLRRYQGPSYKHVPFLSLLFGHPLVIQCTKSNRNTIYSTTVMHNIRTFLKLLWPIFYFHDIILMIKREKIQLNKKYAEISKEYKLVLKKTQVHRHLSQCFLVSWHVVQIIAYGLFSLLWPHPHLKMLYVALYS